jgi:hypothetical protein
MRATMEVMTAMAKSKQPLIPRVTAYLPSDIRAEAARRGYNLSALLRQAILDEIRREDAGEPMRRVELRRKDGLVEVTVTLDPKDIASA